MMTERIREFKVDEVQEVLKLTRNIYKAYKQAPFELKRHYLSLFWEHFKVEGKKITKAVPTRIFEALREDYKASVQLQKPVRLEQACVERGDCHPSDKPSEVQIAYDWGG